MSIDDQLLNKNKEEESADRVSDLREAQRSELAGGEETDEPRSVREAVIQKKREEAAVLAKEEETGKIASAAASPIRKSTSKLLQQAWLNLADSWGLTLLWIDIHVWLGSIVGHNFFCKLGQEWMDNNIVAAENEYAKSQGKPLGTVEPMVLVGCNLGCLFLIIAIVALIAMIAGAIENPLRALYEVLKVITGNFWKSSPPSS